MLFEDTEPKFSEEGSNEQATFVEMRSKKPCVHRTRGTVLRASSGLIAKNTQQETVRDWFIGIQYPRPLDGKRCATVGLLLRA